MSLILVCGPWGSGTTAVSGMLDTLGLNGFGPYFQTNDPRTPNAFESIAFRDVVGSFASEQPPRRTKESSEIIEKLKDFKSELESYRAANGIPEDRAIFLKYPLSALIIPELAAVFPIRLVYVLRPLIDIEATRIRRQWSSDFGEAGAKIVYSWMFRCLIDHSLATLIVRYPDVIRNPVEHARKLAAFAGLTAVPQALVVASAAVIRPSNPGPSPPSHDRA
jgi:hypothetical protein